MKLMFYLESHRALYWHLFYFCYINDLVKLYMLLMFYYTLLYILKQTVLTTGGFENVTSLVYSGTDLGG